MQFTKVFFSLALALIVTATCVAQDAEKKVTDKKQDAKADKADKATERAIKTTTAQMMKTFKKANLTDEQKEKAAAVVKKHIGSLMEARKAQAALLTDEQKKSRTEAMAKAKEEGTKGNKLNVVGTKAMEMSEEQTKKYNAAKRKVNQATKKMKEAITALLTDEQKALMPKRGGKRGKLKEEKADDKDADTTQTVSLKLPGMICEGCAASIRGTLTSVEGIAEIKTNVEEKSCTFTAPGDLNVKAMLDKFAEGGNKQIEGWSAAKGPVF